MANLVHLRGNCDARDVNDPLHTVSAGGQHPGLVSAFMERAFGGSVGQGLEEPAATITSKDRLAMVTVMAKGTP